MDRRTFLGTAATAGLGIGLAGRAGLARGQAAPSDQVVVAVMGVNSRGQLLARTFAHAEGAEVAYVIDVDGRAARKTTQAVREIQDKEPTPLTDFRRALDDEAIDALVIAAPDHWHAPAAIQALKAGKHVYVEKPCSHNPREGELLVEAQRSYDRVVQMGNQRRSYPKVMEAIALLEQGEIGPVRQARCWYARNREDLPAAQDAAVPQWLDWELWQGPAPRKAYQDRWVHYDWHWFWNWGTGEAGNNGVHTLDLARWGLGVDHPTRVSASGGRHVHDHWETPDNQMLTFEYEGGKMATWEGVSYNRLNTFGASTGVVFQGEEGSLFIDGNSYVVFDGEGEPVREVASEWGEAASSLEGTGLVNDLPHVLDFLAAIRTGDRPRSHIEGGHKSTLMCHLANIAHRTGRSLRCNPENGHIEGDEEAMQLWSRSYAPGWEPTV